MFISYDYFGAVRNLNYPNGGYKIVDSDFEENISIEVLGRTNSYPSLYPIIEHIITIYEKRNLQVTSNLIRVLLYFSKRNNCDIKHVISWNKQYNPKYAKYEKDIDKLMVLM